MSRPRRQHGLTLIEVLVSISLLAILLIPAITALQTGIVGADVHADVAARHFLLRSRLDQLLNEPFDAVEQAAIAAGSSSTPSAYSDPTGTPNRLLVYLSNYDGDNADKDNDPFTGGDGGLLWLRVDIEGTTGSLETVRARGY